MFYKHSNIGGRIQASDANAYNPAGFSGEPKESGFRFGDVNTKAVSDGSKVGNLASVVQEIPKNLAKTRELQGLFLTDTGVPVHLKRGMRDVLPYRLTMIGSMAATIYFAHIMYRMSYGLK